MSTAMALPADDFSRLRLRYRLSGALGLLVAAFLLRLPFRAVVGFLGLLRRVPFRPAGRCEGADVVAGCGWAARVWPGRAACLEMSLAAVLAAAAHRRRLVWCLGARLRPVAAAHAWVEAGGLPVGEQPETGHPWRAAIRL
ncbi:lasso peptide biosynthesis B2 protein [Streptomyces mayteni]